MCPGDYDDCPECGHDEPDSPPQAPPALPLVLPGPSIKLQSKSLASESIPTIALSDPDVGGCSGNADMMPMIAGLEGAGAEVEGPAMAEWDEPATACEDRRDDMAPGELRSIVRCRRRWGDRRGE